MSFFSGAPKLFGASRSSRGSCPWALSLALGLPPVLLLPAASAAEEQPSPLPPSPEKEQLSGPQAGPAPTAPKSAPPAPVRSAQDREVVVTASRFEQARGQLTQSVSVLRSEDLELRSMNRGNLSELLRYEAGVFANPLSRNDANWGSSGGLGPKYNTYLLDGLPMDSFVDAMSLDPLAFERVELQRGPASVMYSNYLSSDFAGQQSPLTGTTNFVLRHRVDQDLTRLAVAAGSYSTLNTRAYHQGRAGRLSYFLGGNYEKSDYTNYGTPDSWLQIQDSPAYFKAKLYGSLSYELGSPGHQLSLFAHHTTHSGDVGRPNRDFSHGYDTVNLSYQLPLSAQLRLRSSLGLRATGRRWGEDYLGMKDAEGKQVTPALALREHDGVQQLILPADIALDWSQSSWGRLVLGADAQYARYETTAEAQGELSTQNRARAASAGLFTEEQVQLGAWTLRAGARLAYLGNNYDLLDGTKPGLSDKSWTRVLYSAGLRYRLREWVSFHAGAGTSFVPPSAKSVGGTLSSSAAGQEGKNGQLPSPTLKPESGLGVDAGAELHPWEGSELRLRGFINLLTDAIVENKVSDSPSQSQSINAGKARSMGLELEFRQKFWESASTFANLSLNQSQLTETEDPSQKKAELPFVPLWLANLGVILELPFRLRLAAFANLVGPYYDSTDKTSRNAFGPMVFPSARLNRPIQLPGFTVDLFASVQHFTNQKYALPWQFQDPGLTAMLGAELLTSPVAAAPVATAPVAAAPDSAEDAGRN